MKAYLEVLKHVLENGTRSHDRTGVGTFKVFGAQMRFDLSKGFPAVTTKRLHFKSVVHELIWFLSGSQNIAYLKENGVTIWDEWADADGHVGPLYGSQWRNFNCEHVDQIAHIVQVLKNNPDSRRMLCVAWNPARLSEMALPPCHFAFQCQVINGKLNLHVFLRSLDIFLGAPFDIASYALLTHALADVTNLQVGELLVTATDCHLYCNHVEQAKLQLSRDCLPLPTLTMNHRHKIDDFVASDFVLKDYTYHPAIKAPVAV